MTQSEQQAVFQQFIQVRNTYKEQYLDDEVLHAFDLLYLDAKDAYYRGEEIMSDENFDTLEEILKFYKRDVVNKVDGDSTVAERHKHYTPMLSLEKEQIMEEDFNNPKTIAVLGNVDRFLHRFSADWFEATPKYDGNAISLQYVDGKLDKALTRGNEEDGGGIDRIDKIKHIVPNTIPQPGVVEIRGEVVIDKDLWKEKYSDPTKPDNPRNYVAGVLGRDNIDLDVINDLTFIAYQVIFNADTNPEQRPYTFKVLEFYGFNKEHKPFVHKFRDISEFENIYFEFKNYRENESVFQLDGIVIKYPETKRASLGETSHHPKWAIAIKFPPKSTTTKIVDIIWTIATTGQLTPIAILEPVELDGTEVKRASLHNYGYVLRKNATIGASVEIAKKGDIIPQVIDVLVPGDSELKIPTHCECGNELKVVDGKGENIQHLVCDNPHCKVQAIGKLEKAVKVLKIERIGHSHAERLYQAGIETIIDIFDDNKFSKEKLIESNLYKDGRELEIILNAVDLIKTVKIEQVVKALNFENVGDSISYQVGRILSGLNWDWSGLQKDLEHIFTNPQSKERLLIDKFIQVLTNKGIKIEYIKDEVLDDSTKIYEMTGSPKPHFKTKAEFTDFAKKHNLVHDKLNKDADYLITDSYSSTSSKMKKAEKLGVEVITYEDLLKKFE